MKHLVLICSSVVLSTGAYCADKPPLSLTELPPCITKVLRGFSNIQNPNVTVERAGAGQRQPVIRYSFIDRLNVVHQDRLPIYQDENRRWYISVNDLSVSEDDPGYRASGELWSACGIDGMAFAGRLPSERSPR